MARVVLVTGGCRSGKSSYAQRLAESLGPRRAYVATCPQVDDEMGERILRHRRERAAAQWDTIEEPLDVARAIEAAGGHDVVLVDCLTLWVNNLMFEAEKRGVAVSEDDVQAACAGIAAACSRRPGTVIFVTNEVGMGIVPESALGRRFRDLLGRANQAVAAAADAVAFVACGIPLYLKGNDLHQDGRTE